MMAQWSAGFAQAPDLRQGPISSLDELETRRPRRAFFVYFR